MRILIAGAACAALALGLSACGKKEEAKTGDKTATAANNPLETPRQKPGLWQMTLSTPEAAAPMTIRVCIDEALAKQFTAAGSDTGQNCSERATTPQPDGSITVHTVCDMGTGGKVVTDGQASGDFSSNYVMEATSVTSGASTPQMNRTSQVKVEAKWTGPCPADMKPGQRTMEMPGMSITMPPPQPPK
jgi:hypothetical protein